MKALILIVATTVLFSACSGNPLNPLASDAANPPATAHALATLHLGVDVSTCYALGNVTLSVDGTVVGTVTPGDAGVTRNVDVGVHVLTGLGVTRDQAAHTTWAPSSVTVPAGGYTAVLYCLTTHGYSVGRD